jgi:hypothetical protein
MKPTTSQESPDQQPPLLSLSLSLSLSHTHTHTHTRWLVYWLCLGIASRFEGVADEAMALVPNYNMAKLSALVCVCYVGVGGRVGGWVGGWV